MRTTVDLDPDAEKAVQALRQEQNVGVSEAVNQLIRRGLLPRPEPERFVQRTHDLGLRIDVSNVSEALELIEGPDHR